MEDSQYDKLVEFGNKQFNILINISSNCEKQKLLNRLFQFYNSIDVKKFRFFSKDISLAFANKEKFIDYKNKYCNNFDIEIFTLLSDFIKDTIEEKKNTELNNKTVLLLDGNWCIQLIDSILIEKLFAISNEYNIYIIYLINDKNITISENIQSKIDFFINENISFNIIKNN